MKIKNEKGQYYAIECETVEENNKVFEFLGTKEVYSYSYWNYATTDDVVYYTLSSASNNREVIKFKDWIKLSNEPTIITIPIEDYNKLRALEIKKQIKQLKKELCKLKN